MSGRADFSNKKPGDRVREVRKEHEWTQQRLAEAIGLQPNHISMIEKGKRGLTLDKAKQIAALFPPTRFEYLMCFDNFKTPMQKQIHPIAKRLAEKSRCNRAVENFFDTFNLKFELNFSDPELEKIGQKKLSDLSEEEVESLILNSIPMMQRPDTFLIKKDDEVLGYCSDEERKRLFEEIIDFAEFKITKLTERSGNNG